MAAGNHNLTIDQGADFSMTLTVTQNSSAFNLTGYSVRAQVRKTKEDANVAASFTGTHNDSGGVITLTMNNSVTKTLDEGEYLYDLEIHTANDAAVTRLIQGKVQVIRGITR